MLLIITLSYRDNVSRFDILYRCQYVANYLVQFASDIIDRIKSGDICPSEIRAFVVLNTMLRTLMNNISREEIVSWGQFRVTSFTAGAVVVVVRVNNINITSGSIATTASMQPSHVAELIADGINNHVSSPDYTATVIPGTGLVNVYGVTGSGDSNNGLVITFGTTGVIVLDVISNMQGGVDGQDLDDMCLLEAEIDNLFQYISEQTCLCFQAYDQTYTQPVVTIGGTIMGPLPTGPRGTTIGAVTGIGGTGTGVVGVGRPTGGTVIDQIDNVAPRLLGTGTGDVQVNPLIPGVVIDEIITEDGYGILVETDRTRSQGTI